MKLYAYKNSAGKVIFHTIDNKPFPNQDDDYTYERAPEFDLEFEKPTTDNSYENIYL